MEDPVNVGFWVFVLCMVALFFGLLLVVGTLACASILQARVPERWNGAVKAPGSLQMRIPDAVGTLVKEGVVDELDDPGLRRWNRVVNVAGTITMTSGGLAFLIHTFGDRF